MVFESDGYMVFVAGLGLAQILHTIHDYINRSKLPASRNSGSQKRSPHCLHGPTYNIEIRDEDFEGRFNKVSRSNVLVRWYHTAGSNEPHPASSVDPAFQTIQSGE